MLIPDSAHGTNPASAAIAGFDAVSDQEQRPRPASIWTTCKAKLDDRTAVFMITNPNTLGLFDEQIAAITELLHAKGALVYLDGANMNAILGITRPGDFGVDMMHYNVHKTFTGPHGAGGPGSGPIAVRGTAGPVPAGAAGRQGGRAAIALDFDRPKSIGRVRSFFGNVGILLRGYCYIRTLGPAGPARRSAKTRCSTPITCWPCVKGAYEVPHGDRCMHEFVASAASSAPRAQRISAMDIAKRLLDFGYHAPTVYFPLVVPEAMMIEPTETESKETLDAFADALLKIQRGRRRLPARRAAHAGRSAGPTRSRRPRSRSCGGRANLPAAALRGRGWSDEYGHR